MISAKRRGAQEALDRQVTDRIDLLDDAAIDRYARHLVLPEIGVKGQLALAQGAVAIIGCGGLGAAAALALAQAGMGRLALYDPDRVELSNLHRQPFREDQIGQPKATALSDLCRARNSSVQIDPHARAFSGSAARLWLDCTDSYASRCQIDTLRGPDTSLVFGSVLGMDAQVTVFDAGTPGFASLFPTPPQTRQTCADQGILGPLAPLVAQIMAAEALKLAMGQTSALSTHLLLIDARDWRHTLLSKAP